MPRSPSPGLRAARPRVAGAPGGARPGMATIPTNPGKLAASLPALVRSRVGCVDALAGTNLEGAVRRKGYESELLVLPNFFPCDLAEKMYQKLICLLGQRGASLGRSVASPDDPTPQRYRTAQFFRAPCICKYAYAGHSGNRVCSDCVLIIEQTLRDVLRVAPQSSSPPPLSLDPRPPLIFLCNFCRLRCYFCKQINVLRSERVRAFACLPGSSARHRQA